MRKVGIYEAKLKAKERNSIPDELFGLPKDRKFPLNDEVHVRKAIQFFKYCEPTKRNELASNINKQAKKLGLKLNVSKDNIFYKYADKRIIATENSEEIVNETYQWNSYNDPEYVEESEEYYEDFRHRLKVELGVENEEDNFNDEYLITINSINGLIDTDYLCKNIFKGIVTIRLTEIEIYEIKEIFDLMAVIDGFDCNNNIIYYGIHPNKGLCILAKKIDENGKYKPRLICIEDMRIDVRSGLIDKKSISLVMTNRIFKPRNYDNIDSITEGISIAKNGDIKISISPKKSYMNEYSENHRILKSNLKNKNYNAMKANIAFAFMMISIIEREPGYKNNPDLMKARQFFTNDFVMYLDEVQKHEPSFDFARYYHENEFDKYIVNIPIDTISGIKRIIQSLID